VLIHRLGNLDDGAVIPRILGIIDGWIREACVTCGDSMRVVGRGLLDGMSGRREVSDGEEEVWRRGVGEWRMLESCAWVV